MGILKKILPKELHNIEIIHDCKYPAYYNPLSGRISDVI